MAAKGFTLIELLITTAIIAMLSAVALSTFSYLQKNSRDTRRISDLKVVQSALEQYRADQTVYPLAGDIDMSGSSAFTDPGGNKKYLQKIPLDPQGDNYFYLPLPLLPVPCNNTTIRCTGYCLMASLENGSEIISGCNSASPYDSYNYAVNAP